MSQDQTWSEEHEKLAAIMGSVARLAMNKEHIDRRQMLQHLVSAFQHLEDALALLDRYEP